MPRKGENIYKRKDGRWEGRYIKARTAAGKAIYGYVYAHSYNEVRKKRNQAASAATLEATIFQPDSQPSLSFKKIACDWLSFIQPQIKESSYIKYRNLLQSYVLPEFDKILIDQITSRQLQLCCDHLLTHGGISGDGLSPKTVTDILSLIRNVLRYSEVQGFHPPTTGKEIIIHRSAPDIVVLPLSSQQQLCNYLYSHMSERSLGILLCLFTGMRIGEVCALRWEDFCFQEKTIYVHQTMQRLQTSGGSAQKTAVMVTTPKSKCSIRIIPLPEKILQLIYKEFPNRHGYVLASDSECFVEPRTMQNYFRHVQKQCGLKPVNFHVLRHTFATRCVEVGFDVKSLSEILGHASVNITMNQYVHPSMELKKQNMQKLSGLFAVM